MSCQEDAGDAGFEPIMDREQVRALAKDNGFVTTEVHFFLDDDEDFVILGDNTVDDMTEFMASHGITSLFYEYTYVDESDFYIVPPEDSIWDDDPEFAEALNEMVDDWNDEVYEQDFSEPGYLYLFALYEGRVFGVELWNPDYAKFLELDSFDRYIDMYVEAASRFEEDDD